MKTLNELIGKKIVKIRPMTRKEAEDNGWDYPLGSATSVIELEGGTVIIPSGDDEGNTAGTLFGSDKEGDFYIYSKQVIQ